jgi:hypothetical protein
MVPSDFCRWTGLHSEMTMISQLTRFSLTALALIGFAGSAQALQYAEFYTDDCDASGCEGATLFLSVQEEAGGSWLVTYTINTDNYTGDRNGFNQIGFKAISGWTTGTVLSAPAGSLTNWNPVYDDPIASNSLCDTSSGDTDKVCVFGFVDITAGGDYTWTFRIDDGTLIEDEWHLGAQYAYQSGRARGKIISHDGSPSDTPTVPEPTAALLFGLGALLVGRRSARASA